MKFLLIIYIAFFTVSLSAQTETSIWQKAEISYVQKTHQHVHSVEESSFSPIDLLIGLYRVGFSDVDGDNCAFHPSCSRFFLYAVKRTNIIQGFILAADRLTRDTNVFGRNQLYPYYYDGHFYDPIDNYLFDSSAFIYHPVGKVMKTE